MVEKKAYELPVFRVILWTDEDVLTASDNTNDQFFITDNVDWSTIE